jgi:DNA-binding response OmpR family regulator
VNKRGAIPVGTHKLLIVDDDPNIRELLSVNLIAAGYDVDSVADGKEAIERIKNHPFELIVLDIMMPEIDGWELCKFIRDDPDLDTTKILMLTAKGTERDKLIGRHIFNADEYLTKPFDIDEVKNVIQRLIYG